MFFMPKDIEQHNHNNCLSKYKSLSLLLLNLKNKKISETTDIRKFLSQKKTKCSIVLHTHIQKAKREDLVRQKRQIMHKIIKQVKGKGKKAVV